MNNNTIDYYNLFNKCQKNIENIKFKQAIYYKNKKNALFKKITHNISQKILNASLDGYESLILYETEYDELIVELMNDFKEYFKPFNVTYKKKNLNERGFLEIITEDINYVLVISWKKTSSNNSNVKDNTSQTDENELKENENELKQNENELKQNENELKGNENELKQNENKLKENENKLKENIENIVVDANDYFHELSITDDEKNEIDKKSEVENHPWLNLFN